MQVGICATAVSGTSGTSTPSGKFRELGITVSGQNSFERNVDLKRKLSRRWHRHSEDRTRLTQFYVAGWGRIRSNAPETLQEFASAPAEQLIARGYMGVASWSKVLVMHDPDKYAIFDSKGCGGTERTAVARPEY